MIIKSSQSVMKNTHLNIENLSYAIKRKYPLLSVDNLLQLYQQDVAIANSIDLILDYYSKYVCLNDLEKAIAAFAKVSYDFIYYQSSFLKTGRYVNKSAENIKNELYESEEKMLGYYLHGLFLTYALWPNHVRIYDYFNMEFVPCLQKLDTVLEVGIGHGLMALTLLTKLEKISYIGVDVSKYAINFTRDILRNANIVHSRFKLYHQDITKVEKTKNSYSAGVCCELLEHVENPRNVLYAFSELLKPGSPLFVTTVVNLSAEDHIYLFEDEDQIRRLLNECGYEIKSERIFRLEKYCTANRLCANYAAIISPRG